MSRSTGQRVERELVPLHQDAGLAGEKISRTGYPGEDLRMLEAFTAEVKARKNGEGFAQLEQWLSEGDRLFLRRNRQQPLVLMPWQVYLRLMTAYRQQHGESPPQTAQDAPGRAIGHRGRGY